MNRRRLAVLTTGRQDFGIFRSTVLALMKDARFELMLWAGGMHLSKRFGHTIDRLESEGYPIHERLDFLADPPDPAADSSRALVQVEKLLRKHQPDALVLVGDRSETLAAGFAATLVGTPIIHLHGGEETEGAIDNALRHALTKLAHLHLVTHELHGQRVRQMGEWASTVHVVGPPGLDNLYRDDLPSRAHLEEHLKLKLADPVVLSTVHSSTLGSGDPLSEIRAVTAAMSKVDATYVITEPNADDGGEAIRAHLTEWAKGRSNVVLVKALGELRYFGLLRLAACVLGNSSSGLIEAPALGVPVVNVGDRQKGRIRSVHIVDVPADGEAVTAALRHAVKSSTKAALAEVPGPYPKGPAAPKIVEAMAAAVLPRPARKAFAGQRGGG